MSEQENEMHRMAEIADAINDILNNDDDAAQNPPAQPVRAAEKPDNLDAIIASEFGKNASPQKIRVRENSGLANLSLRMQDTLAELGNANTQNNKASLLAEMQQAQEEMMRITRAQTDKLADYVRECRQQIGQNLEQLEQNSQQIQKEMDAMVTRFETALNDIYSRHNGLDNQEQLERYREFLLYLLDERN